MSHVLLAMSGGVDSSVAAAVLKNQGHRVSGVYLRHSFQQNPQEEQDAIEAAEHLGIELHRRDVDAPFQDIIDSFIGDYLAGRTPNPCALCNRKIKFGLLIEFANSIGADFYATGHYARIVEETGSGPAIFRPVDLSKDQTYVLYGIARQHLPRLRFPLGEMLKTQVREKALALGLHVFEKKDSQEICFVPPHQHVEFIHQQRPQVDTSGHFVSTDGTILGRHEGFERFTIGQRKGMKIGFGKRTFVVRIEPDTKNVILGSYDDLECRELRATETNWHHEVPIGSPFFCDVKIRYRNHPTRAEVTVNVDQSMTVRFSEPKHGVAPGQIAVCYDADRLLGGGIIEKSLP
ncbi:MAG: tRNA 2-thiouridine(34) synthase MnmA [Thermoguttaceae bacterium]